MGQRSPDFVTQKVVMMKPQVADWFERRTSSSAQWPLAHLMSIKGDTTVSVVLPALNEAATVANIVTTIRDHLGDGAGLAHQFNNFAADRCCQQGIQIHCF